VINVRRLSFLAAEPHFVDHLAPVWNALPASQRGVFYTRSTVATDQALKHGVRTKPWAGVAHPKQVFLCAAFGDLNQLHKTGVETILMEHGAGFTFQSTHSSYAGGSHPARDNVKLFLAPGPRTAQKLRVTHPTTPVVEVGCPKLDDRIIATRPEPSTPPKVVVSFHWDCRVVPETRWAFPFYQRALMNLARNPNVELLGHAHPRARRQLKPFWARAGVDFIEDFNDVLDVADVYVADATSTIYEAAAVGIPVVVLNSPMYRRDVEHGLRFWEAANVGPNCDTSRDLANKIFEALNPTEIQVKETDRCLNLVYTHRDGTSAQKAVEAIKHHVL
jgi:hypothetical protein